jgi:hypothetical protein
MTGVVGVVSLVLLDPPQNLAVSGVAHGSRHSYDDRLIHLVADDKAN